MRIAVWAIAAALDGRAAAKEQFLQRGQDPAVQTRVLAQEAAGTPGDPAVPAVLKHIKAGVTLAYYPAGCHVVDPTKFVGLTEYKGSSPMSPSNCFSFCRESDPIAHLGRYFGLKNGRTCWCAAVYDGAEAPARDCTVECDGGGTGCGGHEATSVYHIHMWHEGAGEPPVDSAVATENARDVRLAEQEEEEDTEDPQLETSHFFMWADGRSCGKAPMKVQGKETLVGHPKTCRMACVATPNCMGFTYDDALSQCEYTSDTDADGAQQSDMLHCLMKQV
jgi:hypothetical protein